MLELLFVTLMAQDKPDTLRAEFFCTKFEILDTTLREKYQEEPVVLGRSQSDKATMVVYSNPDRTSFTVVVVFPNRACVIGTGEQLIVRDNQNKY